MLVFPKHMLSNTIRSYVQGSSHDLDGLILKPTFLEILSILVLGERVLLGLAHLLLLVMDRPCPPCFGLYKDAVSM